MHVIVASAQMTAAANASSQHVSSLARWEKIARAADPALDDEQVTQRAEQLRTEHFRTMAARSAAARRADGNPTAAATRSPMHPSSPQRWVLLALEQAPGASAEEIEQLAGQLKAEHYQRIWQTRRAAAGKSG